MDAGLEVSIQVYRPSFAAPAQTVTQSTPTGGQIVDRGTFVTLEVSTGLPSDSFQGISADGQLRIITSQFFVDEACAFAFRDWMGEVLFARSIIAFIRDDGYVASNTLELMDELIQSERVPVLVEIAPGRGTIDNSIVRTRELPNGMQFASTDASFVAEMDLNIDIFAKTGACG